MPPKKNDKRFLKLFANVFSELSPDGTNNPLSSLSKSKSTGATDLLGTDEVVEDAPEASGGASRIMQARRRTATSPKASEAAEFTSSTEYVRLFAVNRAGQTEEACVESVKKAERDFADLLKSLQENRDNLDVCYVMNVRKANLVLTSYLQARIQYLHLMHVRAVDRVRRACRGQYADAVARIMQDSQRYRDNSTSTLIEDHQARISGMQAHTFAVKREARRRADLISKLRTKVARGQVALKRHGFVDSETNSCIPDERMRGEDTLAHLQSLLYEKEDRISDLSDRVQQMETKIEERQVAKGMSVPRRPSRLMSGSANPRGYPTSRRMSLKFHTGPDRRRPSIGPSIASSVLGGGGESASVVSESVATSSVASSSRATTPDLPDVTLESLMNDATTLYESRLEQMRIVHAKRMAALVRDQEQTTKDLERQYMQAKSGLVGSAGLQQEIVNEMKGEGSVCDVDNTVDLNAH
ncbi:hypothetical protein HKX48_000999 [Thoreauomyces humboldtii]|nr:hypothetical protein HKX48_000999 [Thoreauomyces humboldtii]